MVNSARRETPILRTWWSFALEVSMNLAVLIASFPTVGTLERSIVYRPRLTLLRGKALTPYDTAHRIAYHRHLQSPIHCSAATNMSAATEDQFHDALQQAKLYEHAETYEKFNDGMTNKLGTRMIQLTTASPLAVPITSSSIIHDNASGPGIVADELLKLPALAQLSPRPKIHCTDISPPMITMLEKKSLPGIESAVMDSCALTFATNTFTHSFMNGSIFVIADYQKAASEIYRTLQPGGVACVSTIKHAGWMPPFVRAHKRVRPEEPEWPGLMAPEWSTEEHLKGIMEKAGFASEDVYVESYEVPFAISKFLEVQKPIAEMAITVMTKTWFDEEKATLRKVLDEEVAVEVERDPAEMGFWIAVAKKRDVRGVNK